LSRFATKKTGAAEDEEIAELEAEEVEEEEPNPEEIVEGDEDEIDPAVEASDEDMVEQLVNELNGKEVENDESDLGELRQLTCEEINLGQFSLSKVCNHLFSLHCSLKLLS
jgi:hypothetical protein